jgi:Zn-dependent protease
LFSHLSIPTILISYVALLFSLSVHEASHATAAYLLDDDTARRLGRMTINPLAHIDPIGTVIFPLLGMFTGSPFLIGWAKPVPFDPGRLTRKIRLKVSAALISLAGPASNVVLAFIFTVITALAARAMTSSLPMREQLMDMAFGGPQPLLDAGLDPGRVLLLSLGGTLVRLNILLAAFNIIPLGPLDGAGVLGGFLPDHLQYRYNQLRYHPYTWIALIILMFMGVLRYVLGAAYLVAGVALNPIINLVLGA